MSPPTPEPDLAELRARLAEAEETLSAIRRGDVDALVMAGQVYSLHGAETPYRRLIEAMHEGAATLAGDGTVLYANHRLADMLGCPLSDLVGSSLRRFLAPDDVPAFEAMVAQGLEDPGRIDLTFVGRDEGILPVQLSFSGMEVSGVRAVCIVVTDISERKRAEADHRRSEELVLAERRRLLDVLETLPAMICLLTPDYHVAFANRGFREQFGEAAGRRCYEQCFGRSEPCEFCESYRVLKTGQPHRWEVTTPDGTVIDAYDFPFTDADGSPMILEMDIDITARCKAEAEVARYRQRLEEMVQERTALWEGANEELRASNEELSRFNRAMVDRELRMIELKKEVNELCTRAGVAPRYEISDE